jgi:hypothetical protein
MVALAPSAYADVDTDFANELHGYGSVDVGQPLA